MPRIFIYCTYILCRSRLLVAACSQAAIRKKGASRVAPLALVKHVVKFDFQALPFLIGCRRGITSTKSQLFSQVAANGSFRVADDRRTWFTRAFLSTSSHGLL